MDGAVALVRPTVGLPEALTEAGGSAGRAAPRCSERTMGGEEAASPADLEKLCEAGAVVKLWGPAATAAPRRVTAALLDSGSARRDTPPTLGENAGEGGAR